MPTNMEEYKYMINYDLLAGVGVYFSLNTAFTNPLVKKTDALYKTHPINEPHVSVFSGVNSYPICYLVLIW